MKFSILFLSVFSFALTACGSSSESASQESSAHKASACPIINDRFTRDNRYREISSQVTTNGILIRLNRDEAKLTIDGGRHVDSTDARRLYVGSCNGDSILIRLFENLVQVGSLKLSYNGRELVIAGESKDGGSFRETWFAENPGQTVESPIFKKNEARLQVRGEENREMVWNESTRNLPTCRRLSVAQTEYSIDMTNPPRGANWMDKLEISIYAKDFPAFERGERVKLTSGVVTLLMRDKVGQRYVNYLRPYLSSPCEVTVQKQNGFVEGDVDCSLSAHMTNPSLQAVRIKGNFSCRDGINLGN